MDEGNTNNDLAVESLDTIPVEDKVQTFINNLGIKIDPKQLSVALCHRSYIFENNSAVKLEHLKLLELLGFSLLRLIACTKRFTDSISNKQLSVALESDRQNIGFLFYKHYELCNIIQFGKGEQTNHKEFYKDVTSQVLFSIYEETDFYQLYKILGNFFMDLQLRIDYKTGLRNYVQKQKQIPQYKILREFGSDHAKQFEVELTVMNQLLKQLVVQEKLQNKKLRNNLFY